MTCAGIVLRRFAGKVCVALLMLRQCRQPYLVAEACAIQILQRLEALGTQPTSGAYSRAAFS